MNKKKMLRVISLVVVLSLTLTFTVFAAPGNKLPQGQEKKLARYNFNYNTSADYMKEKGIIKGYGNGDFGFNDFVKRGDITVMIVRAFNINTIINRYVENFEDVEYGSYYYDSIVAAKSYGIAKGNGKAFNPKKYVTIEEAILLIERSAAVANSNVTVEDVDLEDLYNERELKEYATRSDIANMLYYVLTGDEYDYDSKDDEDEDYKYDIDAVTFTIKENAAFEFDTDDVDKLIREIEKVSDKDFKYLNFTNLPLKTEGKLYFDYTSAKDFDSYVKSSTDYYETKDPSISDVTFVPKTDFSGTVSIKYTAYDDDENSYTGIIEIIVEEVDIDLGTIKYDIEENKILTFDSKIVNAFNDKTNNEEFDYVKFTLPTTGKLYYDYTSATKYDSSVNAKTEYYDDVDPKISDVTFVPKTDFSGTVSIKYTAYDEDGDSYKGVIEIVVEEDIVTLDTIEYETEENTSLKFDVDDFIDELDDETNNDLNYVKFILPLKSEGKLYYDYSSASSYKSVVTESSKYFVDSSKYLNKVSFVPYTNFDGVVYIDYIAYDEDGISYKGTIKINVED